MYLKMYLNLVQLSYVFYTFFGLWVCFSICIYVINFIGSHKINKWIWCSKNKKGWREGEKKGTEMCYLYVLIPYSECNYYVQQTCTNKSQNILKIKRSISAFQY